MKKKETKELRVLGRMLAEELPKEALEQARAGKVSKSTAEPEVYDIGP